MKKLVKIVLFSEKTRHLRRHCTHGMRGRSVVRVNNFYLKTFLPMKKRHSTAVPEGIGILDLKNKLLNFLFWQLLESKFIKEFFLYIASIKFTQDYFRNVL